MTRSYPFESATQENPHYTVPETVEEGGKTYTLTEDQSWSWRYEANEDTFTVAHNGGHAEISNEKVENCICSVTVTNSIKNEQWLTDDKIVTNRYEK